MLTEKQKYRNWLEAQIKDHGLVAVFACTAADSFGPDIKTDQLRFGDVDEEIYRALNEINAAVARGDCAPITDF